MKAIVYIIINNIFITSILKILITKIYSRRIFFATFVCLLAVILTIKNVSWKNMSPTELPFLVSLPT